ncbi:MAG TPA: ATP-binding protein [Armatimonadota bacterium]
MFTNRLFVLASESDLVSRLLELAADPGPAGPREGFGVWVAGSLDAVVTAAAAPTRSVVLLPLDSLSLPGDEAVRLLRARAKGVAMVAVVDAEDPSQTALASSLEACERVAASDLGTDALPRALAQAFERAPALMAEQLSLRGYRELAEAMPQIVWTARPDGFLDYYNQRWYDYTGLTLEETQGWGWERVLHPEDVERCKELWRSSLEGGGDYEIEYRFLRAADQTYRWHLGRALPVLGERGRVLRWVGTCTDIDDQKRAALAIRLHADLGTLFASSLDYQETLAKLARLLVPDLADWCTIHMLDAVSGRTRLAAVHGQPEVVDLVSRSADQFAPDTQDLSHPVSRVLSTGRPEVVHDTPLPALGHAAGGTEHLETPGALRKGSFLCVPLQARGRMLGVLTLVSACYGRRYADTDLSLASELASRAAFAVDNALLYDREQAARRRLTFLAEVSQVLNSSLDFEATMASLNRLVVPSHADWCVLDVLEEGDNPNWVTAAHNDPARETSVLEWWKGQDAPLGAGRVLGTGRPEMRGRADGPEELGPACPPGVSAYITVPLIARQRLLGTLTVVSEESGRDYGPDDLLLIDLLARRAAIAIDNARLFQGARRAEAALASQAEELSRSNRELEQFAYVASHDLQEPLRMVASYTQLLASRYAGRLDKDADEFIDFALDGARRMQRLITDLLAYSRTGTRELVREHVALESVVRECLNNLGPAVAESGADVTWGPMPTVVGDPTQLQQLLQNLLSNALKFHGSRPPSVRVTAKDRGREWVVAVADSGIGIDPAYAAQVFAMFRRLHTRREYTGSGIGLAICEKIVARHGGRIWVESQVGQGATFSFTLPKQPGAS